MKDLSSFELNRRAREQEEEQRRVHRGIQRAQNNPESVESLTSFALGVISENGKIIPVVLLPSGRQVQIHCRLDVARALVRDLTREIEALEAAANGDAGGGGSAIELP